MCYYSLNGHTTYQPVGSVDITNCTVTVIHVAQPFLPFFKEIYCTDCIYTVHKDKLQNCSCNKLE